MRPKYALVCVTPQCIVSTKFGVKLGEGVGETNIARQPQSHALKVTSLLVITPDSVINHIHGVITFKFATP